MDEICSVPPPLHTLKIWGAGVYSREATGPSLSLFLFVCPSRYDARHRKPRRCVYVLNLGGTGISPRTSPPGKSTPGQKTPQPKVSPPAKSARGKSPPGQKTPGQKHPRTNVPLAKSAPGQKCPRAKDPWGTTSGDIFYCSGSRQLNHYSSIFSLPPIICNVPSTSESKATTSTSYSEEICKIIHIKITPI